MMWAIYLVIGLVSGAAGGLLGIGGAVIIIPLLVFGAKMPQHLAQGTSVGALLLPIGALAAWKYWQEGNMHIQAALLIAVGFFCGGWLGAHFAHAVEGNNLRRAFGVLLLVVGVRMVVGK
jgi:uncharacterized protein